MRRKKWVVHSGDKELASLASSQFNISPLAALILSSRGVTDLDEIKEFFDIDAPLSMDPMSLKDMDKAVERITKAIDEFEMICVFGDYDADGVTATALLYSFLESRGANVIRYIPDRITEGYGLDVDAVEKLKEIGVNLIVTVDNGVTAIEAIEKAYELGIDVVVTDHHKTGDVLPECEAVVDPHRSDCLGKFKEFSGVGIAFKLACAIEGGNEEMLLEEYGELVAIGTVADVVSLTGENRVLVRRGLEQINSSPSPGVAALIEAACVKDKPLSSTTIAYAIGPRINAAGRMGSADKALDLLLCDDPEQANFLAEEINAMNVQRQSTETEIYQKTLDIIRERPDIANSRIIVVDGEDWHQGVSGIVATRLTEKFGRPSVVISRNGDIAKGSCRSIEDFSIYDAIDAVSDTLEHFGGHTLAAGITVKSENIELFRQKINEYAMELKMPFAQQRIDCKINLAGVNLEMLSEIEKLEPFGCDNPQPVSGLFGVTIEEITGVSEGRHIRLLLSKNGTKLNAMFFCMPEVRFPFDRGSVVDLAVNFEKNYYNGETRITTIIRGIRHHNTDEENVLKSISAFTYFRRGESVPEEQLELLVPDRQSQVDVFRCIKEQPLKDRYCETICDRLGDNGENMARYRVVIESMLELGILKINENDCIFVPEQTEKVNLEDAAIMKKIRAMQV